MSNKELDNLFKNKLESISKEPSANAWNKVSGQIAGAEKKGFPYMKVAAAVLLLITFTFVIRMSLIDDTSQDMIADNSQEVSNNKKNSETIENEVGEKNSKLEEVNDVSATQEEELNNDITDGTEEKVNIDKDKPKDVNPAGKQKPVLKSKKTEKTTPKLLETSENSEFIAEAKPENQNIEEIILDDATSNNQTASTEQTVDSEVKGTTIEFNLSDFEKTTIAQNEPTQEEVAQDSAKGFKKILNLMEDVGIGDLRKAKNELLALNTKKNRNEDSE